MNEMWQCSVLGCKNKSKTGDKNVSFHRFPEAGPELYMWLMACGRQGWIPAQDAVVCSEHFKPGAFDTPGTDDLMDEEEKKNILAIPTRHIHICCVCLCTNRKLYNVMDYNLTNHYELVTGILVNKDTVHQRVCWECRAKLKSAAQLRNKAIQANEILNKLLEDDPSNILQMTSYRIKHNLISKLKTIRNEPNHVDNSYIFNENIKPSNRLRNSSESPHESHELIKTETKINTDQESKLKNGTDKTEPRPKKPRQRKYTKKVPKNKTKKPVQVKSKNSKLNLKELEPIVNEIILIKTEKVLSNDEDVLHENIDVQFELKSEDIEDKALRISSVDGDCASNLDDDVSSNEEDSLGKTLKSSDKGTVVNKRKRILKRENRDGGKRRKESVISRKKFTVGDINKKRGNKVSKCMPEKELDERIFTTKEVPQEEQTREIERRRESSNFKQSPYKCDKCFRGFLNKEPFAFHMTRHSDVAGLQECLICKLRFNNLRRLKNHCRRHTVRYICKLCPYVSADKHTAKLHERYHAGLTYECPHCPEVYVKRTTYLSHIRLRHPSDVVCNLCGHSFVNEKGLVMHKGCKHRFINHEVPPDGPTCVECNIQFLNKRALTTHMKESSKHSGPTLHRSLVRISKRPKKLETPKGPFSCDQCDELQANYKAYATHFRRKHPDKNRTLYPVGPYSCMCEECGKIFTHPTALQDHKSTHNDMKQFECSDCGKRFQRKATLVNHIKLHLMGSRKQYPCNTCGKVFTTRANMERHAFIHTGLRPYSCEICEKTFKYEGDKRLHMNYVHIKKQWPKRDRKLNKKSNTANERLSSDHMV